MAPGARAHSSCQPLRPDTAWVTPRMETRAGQQGQEKKGKRPQILEGPWKGLERLPSPEGSGDKPTPPHPPHTIQGRSHVWLPLEEGGRQPASLQRPRD